MDNTIKFSALVAKDRFQGSGNAADLRELKEFDIYSGQQFFSVGDLFSFPPKEEMRMYADKYKDHNMIVSNIARNDKLDWRPVRAFCRMDAEKPENFFNLCEAEAQKVNMVSCNRELVEAGDCEAVMNNFAGCTLKVIARIPASVPATFETKNGNTRVTSYKVRELPVFVRV